MNVQMKKTKKLVVALFHPDDPHGPCLEHMSCVDDLDNFDEFHHFAEFYYNGMPKPNGGQIMVAFAPNNPKFTMAFLGPLQMDYQQADAHAETIKRILTRK